MDVKICINCKHFAPIDKTCERKTRHVPDLVTGELRRILWRNAEHERLGMHEDSCGPEGKYYEPKSDE